jgi:hypothetical protein
MLAPPLSMIATSFTAGPSQHAFAARQLGALEAERLAQCAADTLEAGLDHVVRIFAAHLHVDRRTETVGQRAEEVRHELGGQAADGFAAWPSNTANWPEVDRHLRLRFVHRQQEDP